MRHFRKVWNTVSCSYISVDGDRFWLTSVLLCLLRMRNNLCNWSVHSHFCMLLADDAIWMSTPACQSWMWPHAHKGTPLIWKGVGSPSKGEKASQWPGVPSTRASVLRAHYIAGCILPHTLNIKIWSASERYHRGPMLPLSHSASANPYFLLKRPQCVYIAWTLLANLNQT